jgi:succinyl-CoA synthetase alpha subunit
MSAFAVNGKNVIVQGITGSHGSFHARAMRDAGTTIIAGTSPGKAGQYVDDIPVYGSIKDIQADMLVDISVIFVPAPFAKAAIFEAVNAEIPLIVCITEGIPIHDMLQIKQRIEKSKSTLLGPNCPGLLMPDIVKLGIIPAAMGLPGSAGVVSRSGTLTYEAMAGLSKKGIGQKYIIGIGGDPIAGTSFVDCLELFQNGPDVDRIIMIGEIGGAQEYEAADYVAKYVTKPVFAYITGHSAPAGVQLGHAGAILGSDKESAKAKTTYLSKKGIITATNITTLIEKASKIS